MAHRIGAQPLMLSEMLIDEISFFDALKRAEAEDSKAHGIGTYGEKLLHKTLKYYFEPDESKHEIESYGSVADIRNEKEIIEIQTRSLSKLVPKLDRFLQKEQVTVVYPLIENKLICRINTETGESMPPRKSSKKGRLSTALAEISMIRQFVSHERLRVLVVTVDVIETRMMNEKKKIGRKRTAKINTVPTRINRIIELSCPEDYRQLLPTDLPQSFNATDFQNYTKLNRIESHGALMLLLQLGILTRSRKGSDAYIYSIN